MIPLAILYRSRVTVHNRLRLATFLGLVLLLTTGCFKQEPTLKTAIHIPAQSEWVDRGIIFDGGAEGEWDHYLWGGFAFSVIKKDGTYYLYYQGSSDYRTEYDETVMWRAIGVATSTDGIHFIKYAGSPVLTWSPNQGGEEGAVSSGITLDEHGEIFLFYGANTLESRTAVSSNGRVASSLDGFDFTDLGVVLDSRDRSTWGGGDEVFPVGAINDSGKWIVYYIPNGSPQSGQLGVAYGDHYDKLNRSSAVSSNNKSIPAWGTTGHVRLDSATYAVIINNGRENRTEIRLMSSQTPQILSEPVEVYQFEEVQQAIIFLDEEKETWFMYYQTRENSYGVKVAEIKKVPSTPQSGFSTQDPLR